MRVGERRLNMLRAFNAREGFSKTEDALPEKFFVPLVGTGVQAGAAVDRGQFAAALEQYYKEVGWVDNGNPTPQKLKEIGLEWVAL